MGYTLLLSLIEYKTLVMRGDFAEANKILPQIPQVRTLPAQAWCQMWLQLNLATPCSYFLKPALTPVTCLWYGHLPEDTLPDCVTLETVRSVL